MSSRRRLSSQIFIAQLGILSATTLIGFVLFAHAERSHLDSQFETRAATIASAAASDDQIRECVANDRPGCANTIQRIATQIAHSTGASYVVVIDLNRVRLSHPDPSLIGEKVAEPIVTRDGQIHTGIDNGATGRSANGKAPLYGPDGDMVGEVSAGIRESSVSQELWHELPSYAVWFLLALAVGAVASWELARRLKRRTFGLELDEIAGLLQEREATLHGIREGVVAFDRSGRVSMMNDEAHRLLDIGTAAPGSKLEDLLPPGRLRDALLEDRSTGDDLVLTDDYCLVVNRMPVSIGGQPQGAVVTLRDRTEINAILRELDGERDLSGALRAQQHEFANRLHAVAGMLELGHVDEALDYVLEVRGTTAQFDETLRHHIAAPQIVGLLLGKAAEAGERGIELVIDPATRVGVAPGRVVAMTTIIGNLVDNAFDSLVDVPPPRRVELSVVEDDDGVTIVVADNGPGVPVTARHRIFEDGYTTKTGDGPRGIGLSLVHRLVTRAGGTIALADGPGATFTVTLPRSRHVGPEAVA